MKDILKGLDKNTDNYVQESWREFVELITKANEKSGNKRRKRLDNKHKGTGKKTNLVQQVKQGYEEKT